MTRLIYTSFNFVSSSPPLDERLVAAAKQDLADLIEECLKGQEACDVNYQDGLGNTGKSTFCITASKAFRRA